MSTLTFDQLKQAARDNPGVMGVYKIVCKPTGQTYVGASVSVYRRMQQHYLCLRQGTSGWKKSSRHSNKQMLRLWVEHGQLNFRFEVVETVTDKPELVAREKFWLESVPVELRLVGASNASYLSELHKRRNKS